jgi:hypothetical protein
LIAVAAWFSRRATLSITTAAEHKPAPAPGSDTVYADGARRVTADEMSDGENNEALLSTCGTRRRMTIGHIPGAKLIPAGEILNHSNELPRDKMIVTYCS